MEYNIKFKLKRPKEPELTDFQVVFIQELLEYRMEQRNNNSKKITLCKTTMFDNIDWNFEYVKNNYIIKNTDKFLNSLKTNKITIPMLLKKLNTDLGDNGFKAMVEPTIGLEDNIVIRW